jgi:uncharacterized protein YmfQ (DUF2313 family)
MTFVCDPLIPTPTNESLAGQLAGYLPWGRWAIAARKPFTWFYKFLLIISEAFVFIYQKINELFVEYNPACTYSLLSEWENALGIPQSCVGVSNDLERRRARVLIEDSLAYATTIPQIQRLLDALGFPGVQIIPGRDYYAFEYEFPVAFYTNLARDFTVVVIADSAYTATPFYHSFPYPFGTDYTSTLRCILRRLLPAHVAIEIIQNEDSTP